MRLHVPWAAKHGVNQHLIEISRRALRLGRSRTHKRLAFERRSATHHACQEADGNGRNSLLKNIERHASEAEEIIPNTVLIYANFFVTAENRSRVPIGSADQNGSPYCAPIIMPYEP